MMWRWVKDLDRILRGDATRLPDLQAREIDIPLVGISVIAVVLGLLYGICMGCFALMRGGEEGLSQLLATTLKVPALFFFTLLVTFPSLYVFNALVGSRLSVVTLLRLLVASVGVNLAVLASLGPIVAFFSVCTTSYPFMVLLNVVVFAASGFLGLSFLLHTLHRLTVAQDGAQASPLESLDSKNGGGEGKPSGDPQDPGPLDRLESHVLGRHIKKVFNIWVILFGLVGAQMGWALRPFVGAPGLPFEWFRERQSNFFEAVLQSIQQLFSG